MAKKCPTCDGIYPRSMKRCPIDRSKLILVADADPLIGEVLDGRYTIIRNLGSGAVGAVYQVEHVTLRKHYAAKILYKNMKAKLIARFEREALAASRIAHTNIVDTIDFGFDSHLGHFCILEFLAGVTLQEQMDKDKIVAIDLLRSVTRQLGDGLQAAHDASIVHRDLKPSNVFLQENSEEFPRVKLLDFGLAKLHDFEEGELAELSYTGQVLGTPSFMAPEQTRGVQFVDYRADIYAMGMIIYRMVTGNRPFHARSVSEIMHMQLNVKPTPAKASAPHSPQAVLLSDILDKVLLKDPNARYQSATEFADAVIGALDGGAPATVEPTETAKPVADDPVSSFGPSPTTNQQGQLLSSDFARSMASWSELNSDAVMGGAFSKGRKGPWIALVMVALLIGALGVYFAMRSTREAPVQNTIRVTPIKSQPTVAKVPAKKRGPVLIVAPFDSELSPTGLTWLRAGLTDMFISQLSQMKGVSVVSRQRLFTLLKRHPKAGRRDVKPIYDLSRRLGCTWIVWGAISKVGTKYQLKVSVENQITNKLQFSGTQRFDNISELMKRVEILSETMLERVWNKPRSKRPKTTVSVLRTAKPEAYRAYIRGEIAFNASEYKRAISLYKKAIAIDQTFMMAYHGLAQAYEFIDQRLAAKREINKAMAQLKGGVTNEALLIRTFHAYLHNRMAKSLEYADQLITRAPRNTVYLGALLDILLHNLKIERMLTVAQKIRQLDPTDDQYIEYEVMALSELRRHDQAIKLARHELKRRPDKPVLIESTGRALLRAGRYREFFLFIKEVETRRKPRWFNDMVFVAYRQLGQLGSAIKAMDSDLRSNDPVLVANAHIDRSEAFLLLGQLDKALAEARLALEKKKDFPYGYRALAMVMIAKKNFSGAERVLKKLESVPIGSWDRDAKPYVRAMLALAKGDVVTARTAIEKAKSRRVLFDYGPLHSLELDGKLALVAKKADRCQDVVTKMKANNPHYAPAHLLAAKCLELKGDVSAALLAYTDYLKRTSKADKAFVGNVYARNRIAALAKKPTEPKTP